MSKRKIVSVPSTTVDEKTITPQPSSSDQAEMIVGKGGAQKDRPSTVVDFPESKLFVSVRTDLDLNQIKLGKRARFSIANEDLLFTALLTHNPLRHVPSFGNPKGYCILRSDNYLALARLAYHKITLEKIPEQDRPTVNMSYFSDLLRVLSDYTGYSLVRESEILFDYGRFQKEGEVLEEWIRCPRNPAGQPVVSDELKRRLYLKSVALPDEFLRWIVARYKDRFDDVLRLIELGASNKPRVSI